MKLLIFIKIRKKVKDYLLKGYKHTGNEHSLVIGIDKKGNISEVNEISVGSFDSRYLGPIDDHYEIGKIVLLLDFKYINRLLSLFELNEISL